MVKRRKITATAGPHDKIVDPDIHQLWKMMVRFRALLGTAIA